MSFVPLISLLKDHFWAGVALRIMWFAVPVAGALLAGLVMFFFLMHRMRSAHQNDLNFSTKGLGRQDPEDAVLVPDRRSLGMALFLTFLLGGFGLFYLSVLAGFIMSILTIFGLVLLWLSIKAGITAEVVLWVASVVTSFWLWKKQSNETWYRIR
jgi:hypothetical protein